MATKTMASKAQKKGKATAKKIVSLGTASQTSKRFDPLTAFARNVTPILDEVSSSQLVGKSLKGKEREKKYSVEDTSTDDRLWVDIYEPITEADLAVHVKKVEDVRRWLSEAFDGGPSGKLKKYRRVLALTGPAGTGKTSTIRVLAHEMGFEILEWRNTVGEASTSPMSRHMSTNASNIDVDYASAQSADFEYDPDYENLFTKFEAFLTRAASCHNIFSSEASNRIFPSQSQSKSLPNAQLSKRQIVLLEDLPNILHPGTQSQFHAALQSLVESPPSWPPVPVVIIISDSGIRGEASDEQMAYGGWGKEKNEVVDIRTVLSRDLLHGPYVTQIGFNPIAQTLLRKAVQSLLNQHFTSASSNHSASPSKEVVDIIVESANGDIRNAIMALQFASVVKMPGKNKQKRALVMEAVTRREQSLVLFHLMGKVFYNKRKGDPPNPSASAKELQRDQDIDAQLNDLPALPKHLRDHARRTSRVNVDLLYADSPIDSSLFSLYIHQNYTQFCDTTDQCEGISDWLSFVDSSGGEAWYQANPHQFHLMTLGTLHSLPTPVPRRSQKIFKPEFFSYLQKEKDAWDGVRDARNWFIDNELENQNSSWRVGGWSKGDVALELGAILKAKMTIGLTSRSLRPPASHKLFSKLDFVRGDISRKQQLGEGDVDENEGLEYNDNIPFSSHVKEEKRNGGWLENDDIEEC